MGQVFRTTSYTIGQLMDDIEVGDLALPDIQRPFVWYRKSSKVSKLFDSIYQGYPVGYLLFWENANRKDYKNIGFDEKKRKIPRFFIIDGQQRLTALYAVIKGQEILTPDFEKKKIRISFRPIDALFQVADAATDRDPDFIPDISSLWMGDGDFSFITNFLTGLKEKKEITSEEERTISTNIQNLINVLKYPLTALEIFLDVTDEVVAEIFVRINSQGVSLTQADFILTLLSVFWEQGRKEIERFCMDARIVPDDRTKYSSYNHVIKPDPDDILRVLIGITFNRAKMKDAYSALRGKDFDSDEFSEDLRNRQFAELAKGLPIVLDNTNWQSFLKILIGIGYKDEELISSKNAVLFSYVIYLIAKEKLSIENHRLQRIVARWFLMSSITGRYSSSPETIFESDLNKIKELGKEAFVIELDKIISDNLTNDFWNITLVNALETSSAQSPVGNAYYAALNMLGAPILFSKKLVGDLFDPSIKVRKKRLEKHHIFPRNYLIESRGYDKNKDKTKINQVANLTFLEFEDNIEISDLSPKEYFTIIGKRFTSSELQQMLEYHALPENFYEMDYEEFLSARRKRMATIIKKALERV